MKQKKVVFFTTQLKTISLEKFSSEGCSGTVYSYLIIAKELVRQGFCVTILSTSDSGVFDGVLFKNINSDQEIISFFKTEEFYDVIIGVSYSSTIFKEIYAPDSKKIFWWHNVYTSNFFNIMPLVASNHIDKVVAVGKHQLGPNLGHILRQSFKNKCNLFSKISVISNPIETELFPSYKYITQKENKVAFVGNPAKQQGFVKILEIYSILLNFYPDLQLGVFGGGALHSKSNLIDKEYNDMFLKKYLDNEKINKGITFYGVLNRKELYEKLKTYKFSLLGLKGLESFCISANESCGCGVPVVSRKKGGQSYFLKEIGFLAENDSEILDFSKSILEMDSENRKHLEKKCLRINDEFKPQLIINSWIRIFNAKNSFLNGLMIFFTAIKERLYYKNDTIEI